MNPAQAGQVAGASLHSAALCIPLSNINGQRTEAFSANKTSLWSGLRISSRSPPHAPCQTMRFSFRFPKKKKTKKTVLQPDIRPEKSNVVAVRLSLVLIFKCGVGVFLASRGIRWQNFSLAEHFQKKKKCSSRKLDGNPMRVKI